MRMGNSKPLFFIFINLLNCFICFHAAVSAKQPSIQVALRYSINIFTFA